MRTKFNNFRMVALIIVLMLILGGCAVTTNPDKNNDDGKNITTNDIEYKVVPIDELDQELLDMIEMIKHKKGYSILREENDFTYLYIGMGEKPSGGYDIKVISAEDIEGVSRILIDETAPGKDDMVTQALTYPFVVIKIKTDMIVNLVIEKNVKEKYEEIKASDYAYSPEDYDIFGTISKLDLGKGILTFLIEANEGTKWVYDKAYVTVDTDTIIFLNGEKLDFSSLADGLRVGVVFKGPVKESYPVQADGSYVSDVKPEVVEIPFEEISGDDSLEYIRQHRGFGIIREDENYRYVFIGSGEKNTGGYDITVKSVVSKEGIIEIIVSETSPGKDDMVIQVITYPHKIIRISKEYGMQITVITNEGEVFEDINDETSEDR